MVKNASRPNWSTIIAPATNRLDGFSVKARVCTAITALNVRRRTTSICHR